MTVEQWLENNKLGIGIFKKYRYNNESFDDWLERVSGGNQELKQLILEKKFLFGGRALSNRGTDESGSMFNCYSSGYCPDDLIGIMQLNTNLALTYKSQGGQGVSLSKVRPIGTPIGKRYKSDGIIPFLDMFNKTTETISQGGSRKGALMVSLDIRHKEAEAFINIKTNTDKINKANLSLEIDDEFMDAVKHYYETGNKRGFHEVRNYNGHVVEYDVIPIDLYKLLVKNCYDWAEPACLYTNRFRNYNLMEFDPDYEIEGCNPCGEQPLPKDFCCNLGSPNVSEFVVNPYSDQAYFDFYQFKKSIHIAVRALDDIIDENKNNHALNQQKENSLNYRNIGTGVMGYATCLMKLGIKYGSEKAKHFTEELFYELFRESVYASSLLAKERGTFPKYKDVIFESTIIKNHFNKEEIYILKQNGLRNCSLVSIAPTGSIANLLGVSNGCEPEFSLKYTRKTESLNNGKDQYYEVNCNALEEYHRITGKDDIPDYFVSSNDIYWKDRVDIQAIMQNHVDTAISSTVNLPIETTLDDVEQLYIYAWEKGLKGITIFYSGGKREGILTTESKSTKSEIIEHSKDEFARGMIETVPREDLRYRTYKLKTGCGNLYLFIGIDEDDGKIYDIFTNTDGVGGCTINTQANSRLISACLRGGVPIEYVIDQLNKSGTCPSFQYKRGKGEKLSSGKSCPSAIANVLSDILKEFEDVDSENEKIIIPDLKLKANQSIEVTKMVYEGSICKECGSNTLVHEGGCDSCKSCGYSTCG